MKSIYAILFISTALCLGSVDSVSQDLLLDIKNVSQHYAATENYVLSWSTYIMDDPRNKLIFMMKKCGDNYLLTGNNQINCINGKKQLSLNTEDKLAVFADEVTPMYSENPIQFINDLFRNGYSNQLTAKEGEIKNYHCQSLSEKEEYIDIWINSREWTIIKVVQHLNESTGHDFVFELEKYLPYCEAGPEINILSYCTFDSKQKPTLRPPYYDYQWLDFKVSK